MAKPHQRVIALTIALVFLGTVLVSGAAVIWQIMQDSNNSAVDVSDVLEQDTLAGTQLADFNPVNNVGQLEAIDLEKGNGEEVKTGATVTAHYTGALASDGTIFESSRDVGQPVEFPLEGVIAGWTEGVPGMKVGGKRRLLIPAEKAYGNNPPPGSNIPPGADLVFDIEITAVKNN